MAPGARGRLRTAQVRLVSTAVSSSTSVYDYGTTLMVGLRTLHGVRLRPTVGGEGL